MTVAPVRAPVTVPTGNAFDKYGSGNPLVRALMARFQEALTDLVRLADPGSVLDVGCGEGILARAWAQQLRPAQVVGLDLEDPRLRAEWSRSSGANLRFVAGRAEALPFGDGEFDLVAAVEALEHVPDPDRALAEMARVSGRHILVSVPREPLWRCLNVMRGAYLGALGNTPGHLHHWSRTGLLDLIRPHGSVLAVRSPLPWTMALVRVG